MLHVIQHTFETIGDNNQHMIDLTDFEADEDLHPEPGTFASFYLSTFTECTQAIGQETLLRTDSLVAHHPDLHRNFLPQIS
jgi:hypothetical protein